MKHVLFVCVHNAGRSQMAEAIVNHLARGWHAESAGTIAGRELNPAAVEAMREIGIDMSSQRPKLLTPEMAARADQIVTMGCGVDAEACPVGLPGAVDWGLDDPAGQPIERIREIRDEIVHRVRELVEGA